MRKFLTYALLLGAAIAISGVVGADEPPGTPGTATAVLCDWQGGCGSLALSGAPGEAYQVFDATGLPVGMGLLEDGTASLSVGNTGVGPDGVLYFVQVGDEALSVTDPDWEWN